MDEQAEISTNDGIIELRNDYWLLQVDTRDSLRPCRLVDLVRDIPLADEAYCYELELDPAGDGGYQGASVSAGRVNWLSWQSSDLARGGRELQLRGRFDFGLRGPTDIEIEHVFRLPDRASWFEEQIRLVHRFGRDEHLLRHFRFGFRKTVYDRDGQCWCDGADQRVLVAVPHRRRWGQVQDHLANAYSTPDLFPANWSGDQLPGRGAEAWVWTDGKEGFLIAKYNREQIEFALVDGEFVVSPDKSGDDPYRKVGPAKWGADVCLRFAGAGRYRSAPDRADRLRGESTYEFGATRIVPIQGDWQNGYRAYKELLLEKGHSFPADFDPPVHWNELYNLGWRGGFNTPLQELPELYAEAALAKDIGAEAFYFDPVWDIFEGSSVWDEARLGPLPEFVASMRDRFGLKTSLHLMMHTKSMSEDPRIYRRDQSGAIDIFTGLYTGGRICAASPVWQSQKTERLLQLAEAGVTFFMFDFCTYVPPDTHIKVSRPQGTACWSSDHGHEVPLTMQGHAEGILKVIQAVKTRFPDLLIEAHDRITGGLQDFHPLYFQHGLPGSFDENWGFEYMWDPLIDLLSGKALSLYEYNLAYDIPLYLHINCGKDNEQMLAFWWYASTCRHLGIGGVQDPASPLYRALKQAMVTYRRLKPFFASGRFVGVEPMVHAHSLPDRNACVFVLFNLSGQPVTRHVSVAMDALGVAGEIESRQAAVQVSEGLLTFSANVPALSPLVVEVNTD